MQCRREGRVNKSRSTTIPPSQAGGSDRLYTMVALARPTESSQAFGTAQAAVEILSSCMPDFIDAKEAFKCIEIASSRSEEVQLSRHVAVGTLAPVCCEFLSEVLIHAPE